jgi:hypothetical protein
MKNGREYIYIHNEALKNNKLEGMFSVARVY